MNWGPNSGSLLILGGGFKFQKQKSLPSYLLLGEMIQFDSNFSRRTGWTHQLVISCFPQMGCDWPKEWSDNLTLAAARRRPGRPVAVWSPYKGGPVAAEGWNDTMMIYPHILCMLIVIYNYIYIILCITNIYSIHYPYYARYCSLEYHGSGVHAVNRRNMAIDRCNFCGAWVTAPIMYIELCLKRPVGIGHRFLHLTPMENIEGCYLYGFIPLQQVYIRRFMMSVV